MIVVNLFAGPGSGKSTTCAGVFAKLKLAGVNCEMALEYAKDKVWEESNKVLDDQIYVFGKQLHRIFRLKDKVDVVITDSPILLSIIYDKTGNKYFSDLVLNQFDNALTQHGICSNALGRFKNHRMVGKEHVCLCIHRCLDSCLARSQCNHHFTDDFISSTYLQATVVPFLCIR